MTLTNEYDLRQALRKIGNGFIRLADDDMTPEKVAELINKNQELVTAVRNFKPLNMVPMWSSYYTPGEPVCSWAKCSRPRCHEGACRV